MKHRVLLAGNNQAVINEFFVQMDRVFECQCCSIRYEDIKSHIKYFEPDIMVFCAKGENKDDFQVIVNIHTVLEGHAVPLVLLSDMADYEAYRKMPNCAMELFIQRPITASNIEKEIILFLTNRANAKRSSIGLKKTGPTATTSSKDTLDLLAQVEAELELIDVDEPRTADNSSKKRILIVDDDVSMLKTIKGHLDDKYLISTATSGALARKFLTKKKADLILLDYEMPFETGADVMRVLRANKQTRNIPIIFLTGVNQTSKIQEVLALKPQGYLLKPVQHDSLLEKIEEVLR